MAIKARCAANATAKIANAHMRAARVTPILLHPSVLSTAATTPLPQSLIKIDLEACAVRAYTAAAPGDSVLPPMTYPALDFSRLSSSVKTLARSYETASPQTASLSSAVRLTHGAYACASARSATLRGHFIPPSPEPVAREPPFHENHPQAFRYAESISTIATCPPSAAASVARPIAALTSSGGESPCTACADMRPSIRVQRVPKLPAAARRERPIRANAEDRSVQSMPTPPHRIAFMPLPLCCASASCASNTHRFPRPSPHSIWSS